MASLAERRIVMSEDEKEAVAVHTQPATGSAPEPVRVVDEDGEESAVHTVEADIAVEVEGIVQSDDVGEGDISGEHSDATVEVEALAEDETSAEEALIAADNLLSVELVTADGDIVEVSESSDSDLFWALRGGGGNFGIAASLEYQLHPLEMVTGGLIAHPIDAAGDMLRFYRDAVGGSSDDLSVFAGLVHAPDGSGMKLVAMIVFHTGTPEDADRELARSRQRELE